MFRVTSPTHTFILNDIYVEDIDKLIITYQQDGYIILEKTAEDCVVSGNSISVTLTQEETKKFSVGKVDIQIRILTIDGVSLASKIFTIDVKKVLNSEVMTHDN